MLFDITRISGNRVDQVDELKITQHLWFQSTDLLIALAGLGAGAVPAAPIMAFTQSSWPLVLSPVGLVIALTFFTRKRSVAGELNPRRFDRMRDEAKALDGQFILPGSGESFSPNGYRLVEQWRRPIYGHKAYKLDLSGTAA